MDDQTYRRHSNYRLRASMILHELERWQDWVTDDDDRVVIEALEVILHPFHRRHVEACTRWENNRWKEKVHE